jgi:hypothetical protein
MNSFDKSKSGSAAFVVVLILAVAFDAPEFVLHYPKTNSNQYSNSRAGKSGPGGI